MSTKANIILDQGADFHLTINIVDVNGNIIDLTGLTGVSKMKKYYTSTNAISFSVSINAVAGQITLSLPASNTAVVEDGTYVYDVEVYDSSNNISRVCEGLITVSAGVTLSGA